ncbi:MAG: cystathionine beta-synthase [Actinobacteria bacterium]|nr:cystathionine beta-synthase [Actinomycetota bacterium]
MDIADSIIDLIGNTPMVRLPRVAGHLQCQIVAKVEGANPGGSSKDRPALAMIDAAEASGELQPGGTIVEPTSGNTGVGLAIVAAQRGYKCVFVMTDKVATEKVDLLRAYGAEVVVCPVAVAPEDPDSYYSTAERLVREIPGAYRPNQYFNQVNPQSHEQSTGPEIWDQTDGTVTHFVAGAGTGGTLGGVGRYLKSKNPDIQIIAADPEGSVYSGGSGRPYLVEGVGEDFWPPTYDPDVVDQVIAISDADSFAMARKVSHEEGLLIGGSCGTAMAAALQLGEQLGPDDLVVVLLPDSGRGYLSKVFNDSWMAEFGFLTTTDGVTVGDVLDNRGEGAKLLYVRPTETVRDAVELMRLHNISQLPVAKNDWPLAAAEVMGSVNELRLMEVAFGKTDVLDLPIEQFMTAALPTIGTGQPIELAVEYLDSAPALLVLSGGRPCTILTRSDVLNHLSPEPLSAGSNNKRAC